MEKKSLSYGDIKFSLTFCHNKFKYAKFSGGVQFHCFRLEIHFLGKFFPKNQNCQFKLKLDT